MSQTLADAYRLAGETQWVWPGWIAKGYVTLLAGRKGLGKSTLALDWFGRSILLQRQWPDGVASSNVQVEPDSYVLWLEAEAGHQINAARAVSMGVPLNRIRLYDPPFGKSDAFRHFTYSKESMEWVKATLLDPLCVGAVVDALSGTYNDDENSAKLGKVVLAFADIAQASQKPVLLLHHKSKRQKDRDGNFGEDSLESVRGSSALVQYARVVISLDAPLGDNKPPFRISQFANNLAAIPEPLGYHMNPHLTYVDAPEPRPSNSLPDAIHIAVEFLSAALSDGAVLSSDLFSDALSKGISDKSLRRAKTILGATAYREGDAWFWTMPDVT